MRLTTKGRFAVTAMLDLALQNTDKPVTLADISERQGISLSYLEQLFSRLRRNGLVKSVRGPGGGYRIAKNQAEITISEIITAVDELIDATQCGGQENCRDERRCIPSQDDVTTHSLVAADEIRKTQDGVARMKTRQLGPRVLHVVVQSVAQLPVEVRGHDSVLAVEARGQPIEEDLSLTVATSIERRPTVIGPGHRKREEQGRRGDR